MGGSTETLRFGEHELDFVRRELRRDEKPLALQPTPLRVLLYLAEHRDRTVPRRELLDAIWPGVVVGDEALLDSRALEAWIRLSELEISTGETEKVLREAYARGGLESATAAYLEALVSRDGTPCTTTAHGGARMLALMGDSDRMLACLDRSIEEHFVDWLAKVHPIYDPYRDDPRFQAHLRRIGL